MSSPHSTSYLRKDTNGMLVHSNKYSWMSTSIAAIRAAAVRVIVSSCRAPWQFVVSGMLTEIQPCASPPITLAAIPNILFKDDDSMFPVVSVGIVLWKIEAVNDAPGWKSRTVSCLNVDWEWNASRQGTSVRSTAIWIVAAPVCAALA